MVGSSSILVIVEIILLKSQWPVILLERKGGRRGRSIFNIKIFWEEGWFYTCSLLPPFEDLIYNESY
jgi:hypothetical protein